MSSHWYRRWCATALASALVGMIAVWLYLAMANHVVGLSNRQGRYYAVIDTRTNAVIVAGVSENDRVMYLKPGYKHLRVLEPKQD